MILEVCVDHPASVEAAVRGGADRLELCSALGVGGLTPSEGFLALAAEMAPETPRMVMIRPREGGFVYSPAELDVALRDIESARKHEAAGVVFGALTESGNVDASALAKVMAAARPMSVTFHRAFDLCSDPRAALNVLIEFGVDRLLTSGKSAKAVSGADVIAELNEQAAGRLVVIAGGGVDCRNLRELVERGNVREIHASASRQANWSDEQSPFAAGISRQTCQKKVAALVDAIRRIEESRDDSTSGR